MGVGVAVGPGVAVDPDAGVGDPPSPPHAATTSPRTNAAPMATTSLRTGAPSSVRQTDRLLLDNNPVFIAEDQWGAMAVGQAQ